jgi:CBS domain-containing protein
MKVQSTEETGVLSGLTVRDAMRPGVVTCLPADGLATLAAIMVTHGVHAAVLGPLSDGAPLIVTDIELVRAALEGADDARAVDIARDPVATLPADASLDLAVAKMAELYLEHVLATDPATGVPCGIISSFDIASAIGGHRPGRARVARSGPARPWSSARTLREAMVGHVMHPGVVTCTPDAPMWTVGRTMAEHRVHCVAVAGVGATGEHTQHFTWGLIDALELVRALHRGALDEPAGTIAVTGPIAVLEGDSLEMAAKLMIEDGARHVVVVGASGLPCGIVSTLDVASIVAVAVPGIRPQVSGRR